MFGGGAWAWTPGAANYACDPILTFSPSRWQSATRTQFSITVACIANAMSFPWYWICVYILLFWLLFCLLLVVAIRSNRCVRVIMKLGYSVILAANVAFN